ncbi:MAG: S1C family serine protease, partial [Planctomycetales bacterium]
MNTDLTSNPNMTPPIHPAVRFRCRLSFLAFCAALAIPSGFISAADLAQLEEQAIRTAVDRVAKSVVRIQTVGGLERVGKVSLGEGPCTGLVVSADGYIISSSFNFARQPTTILVELPNGSTQPAKLVASDKSRA